MMKFILFLLFLCSYATAQTATPTPTPTCVPDLDPCLVDGECCVNRCVGNECCPLTYSDCTGVCIDTNNDPNNCGACGAPCPVGFPICSGGVCFTAVGIFSSSLFLFSFKTYVILGRVG